MHQPQEPLPCSSPASRPIRESTTPRGGLRRCRQLIQACLREEEWADADREFYLICREELAAFADPPERDRPP